MKKSTDEKLRVVFNLKTDEEYNILFEKAQNRIGNRGYVIEIDILDEKRISVSYFESSYRMKK